MKLNEIFKDTFYNDTIFSEDAVSFVESMIFIKSVKGIKVPCMKCLVREKEIKITPEEAVRQLYLYKLIYEYDYSPERIQIEREPMMRGAL